MPIIAMRATSALKHPNADTLRVYAFEAPGHAPVQIVANQDYRYETGDVAMVALVGTTLLDGLRIKRAKLRGVESLGMAMGPTEAEPGSDLSEGRCQPEPSLGEGHLVKWTSIELLHNILANVRAKAELDEEAPPTVEYRAKVKLHGTNCGVQILPDGGVIAQGRNQLLSEAQDNMGFAAWLLKNATAFEALAEPGRHLILFGEWCGSGIQKGVSICEIGRKVFAVFAVQVGDHLLEAATLITSPEAIVALVPSHPDVFVLPWYGDPVNVSFAEPAAAAEALEAAVHAVESNDPWVQEVFGVAGTGEGVVLYPQLDTETREDITALMFKAKGDKHRVRRSRKAVEVDPEVLRSVNAFVATFATEARFEQALGEACSEPAGMSQMGGFLKWVGQDIRKESLADLEESKLEWKQVGKATTAAARAWFIAKVSAL